MNKKIMLNIGAGDRQKIPGFTNIDVRKLPNVDYVTTADNLYMFGDNSVDLIYSSCMLEHLKKDELDSVLREWYRVLKTGGIVRISVPDFEKIAIYYLEHKKMQEIRGLLLGKQDYAENTHYQAFDFATLSETLKYYGFKNTQRYDWRKTVHKDYDDFSRSYLPNINEVPREDYEKGMLMCLNVEAEK